MTFVTPVCDVSVYRSSAIWSEEYKAKQVCRVMES